MLDFMLKGGPLMVPIILCSVISLAIMIERGYVFYRARSGIARNLDLICRSITDTGRVSSPLRASLPESLQLLVNSETDNSGTSREHREHGLSRAASGIIRDLEKHLRGLAIIGSITPIIGLLGTVTGMIRAFMAIQDLGGQVDASVLAGGIWEALITTAAGLAVAIPTQIAYHYFEGRADDIAEQIHDTCHELLDKNKSAVEKAN